MDVPPGTKWQVPADEDRSQAMTTWAASLLAPIAAELGEARQSMERQAETIRDQAERLGRQGAELAAERERGTSFHAEVARVTSELAAAESSRRRERRGLSIALAVVCTMLVIAGTLAAAGWAG